MVVVESSDMKRVLALVSKWISIHLDQASHALSTLKTTNRDTSVVTLEQYTSNISRLITNFILASLRVDTVDVLSAWSIASVMESSPAVGVYSGYISITLLKDSLKSSHLLLMRRFREYSLVEGSLAKDTLLLVNFIATVHQEAQVLSMSLRSSLVEVL